MDSTQLKTITVGDKTYDITGFSAEIQNAAMIYNQISNDKTKAQLEVLKCEAALSVIGKQIADAIQITTETGPVN